MPESGRKSYLEQIVEIFARHGVEYLIIGGQAEALFGSPRVTYDTDFCYRRTRDNLERLAAALKELNPALRGAPPDLPFVIDARSLALGEHFTFKTRLGDLDLLGRVEPIGNYDALLPHAETYPLAGFEGEDHLARRPHQGEGAHPPSERPGLAVPVEGDQAIAAGRPAVDTFSVREPRATSPAPLAGDSYIKSTRARAVLRPVPVFLPASVSPGLLDVLCCYVAITPCGWAPAGTNSSGRTSACDPTSVSLPSEPALRMWSWLPCGKLLLGTCSWFRE